MSDGRRTPLYDEHVRLGGKMVEFAGYTLPIQYPTGIREEHRAVRSGAGLFDVSHMGEVSVEGPDALALVQHLTVNDASRLEVGRAQYSVMCLEDGGALDDLLVYRTGEAAYLLVINAANRERKVEWIRSHASGRDLRAEDISDRTALLALQGPRAAAVLADVTETDLDALTRFSFVEGMVAGVDAIVSRTGYTGEDGFELYLPWDRATEVWEALLEAGGDAPPVPIGLGARDTLRLEAGLLLYGNDLDEEHTPLEAGLGWAVKLDKGPFVGSDALARQKEEGLTRRLTGIRLVERGFPRPGYSVVSGGEVVGAVTSGTMSPSVGTGIALAYLPPELTESGTSVGIRIRDRDVAGVVQRPPFHTPGAGDEGAEDGGGGDR